MKNNDKARQVLDYSFLYEIAEMVELDKLHEALATLQEIMLGMLPEEKDYASGDEIVEFGVNMSINIPEVDAWNECRTQMEQNIRGGFNNG